MRNTARQSPLSAPFRFTLFVTSYAPLFTLLAFNQFTRGVDWIHWGGFSFSAFKVWFSHFALATASTVLVCYGLLSLWGFIHILNKKVLTNGTPVKLIDVRNRNSEAISYIGTYIIPFLFQQYSSLYEGVATLILLLMVYQIYIHSTLMMINPVLTMLYSLYEVDIQDSTGNKKTGMLIVRDRYLDVNDSIKVYPIGPRLYFGKVNSGDYQTSN